MTSALPFPRPIQPSLIEAGDKIRVTLPADHGVQVTKTGVVHRRTDHGAIRYLVTQDGGVLLAWEPGRKGVKVELLARPEPEQQLLSLFEELEERLAG